MRLRADGEHDRVDLLGRHQRQRPAAGSVQTGSRAIWELNQVQVIDGGPDGLASTAGNGVFAVPGVLVP